MWCSALPVTHTPPTDPADAVEIPPALKAHLGLDDFPSWIVVTETNDFLWPGPDLRPVPGQAGHFDYGMLPPRFFAHVRDRTAEYRPQKPTFAKVTDDPQAPGGERRITAE